MILGDEWQRPIGRGARHSVLAVRPLGENRLYRSNSARRSEVLNDFRGA